MHFEFEYIKVSLKTQEAWTIMFALKDAVFSEHTIKNHWVNHGVNSMLETQKHEISLARSFWSAMGKLEDFESYKNEAIKKLEQEIINSGKHK